MFCIICILKLNSVVLSSIIESLSCRAFQQLARLLKCQLLQLIICITLELSVIFRHGKTLNQLTLNQITAKSFQQLNERAFIKHKTNESFNQAQRNLKLI